MMKIIVTKPFNYDHRPQSAHCTMLRPSKEEKTVKREVGEAAVAAGCATEVKTKQVKSGDTDNGES